MNKKEVIEYIAKNIDKFYGYAFRICSNNHRDYTHEAVLKINRLYSDGSFDRVEKVDRMVWLVIRSVHHDTVNRNKVVYVSPDELPEVRDTTILEHEKAYGRFIQKIDQVVRSCGRGPSEENYYHLLYKFIHVDGDSQHELSRNTGIGVWHINRGSKMLRERIKAELTEDYQDLINKDYELII